jgi:hypothetical protein
MGEVKMSIKCNIDPSKFRMPSLEAVFRMVEDKCFRSYKSLPPNFSISSLINEICECVEQVGNDHTAEYNIQSDSFDNGRNLQKEPMMNGAALVKPIACISRGGGKYKSVEDSWILETSDNDQANSMVAQHLAPSHLSRTHDASDISRGEEKVRISVVNEFGSDQCPSPFYYKQRNLVSQKPYANISAARIGDEDGCADCFGNCLSAPVPCACARETGGEFAYTPDGLVRAAFIDECFSVNLFPEKHRNFFCKPLKRSRNEAPPEPCSGQLVRKVIKECWSKCGCNMQCGNRVVQRGITCNLQVISNASVNLYLRILMWYSCCTLLLLILQLSKCPCFAMDTKNHISQICLHVNNRANYNSLAELGYISTYRILDKTLMDFQIINT